MLAVPASNIEMSTGRRGNTWKQGFKGGMGAICPRKLALDSQQQTHADWNIGIVVIINVVL